MGWWLVVGGGWDVRVAFRTRVVDVSAGRSVLAPDWDWGVMIVVAAAVVVVVVVVVVVGG